MLFAIPLTLTRGWASPEVGAAYDRAHALCQTLDGRPELFPSLVGVLTYHLVRGHHAQALEMAESNLRLARRVGDPGMMLEAEHDAGTTRVYMGDFDGAQPHFERALALYDAKRDARHVFAYGKDAKTTALSHLLMIAGARGEFAVSAAYGDQGVAAGAVSMHPFSMLWADLASVVGHVMRGDLAATRDCAARSVSESQARGFPNWMAQALVYLGWARALLGEPVEGIAQMRQGIAIWRMTGAELMSPVLFALLGEALTASGEHEGALGAIAEGVAIAERNGHGYWRSELYVHHARALYALGRRDEARQSAAQAAAIAAPQRAPWFEARAQAMVLEVCDDDAQRAAALGAIDEVCARSAEPDTLRGHITTRQSEARDRAVSPL